MKLRSQFCLLLCLISVLTHKSTQFNLFLQPLSTQAACSDGSPAPIYTYVGEDPDHVLIYFQNGQLCLQPAGTSLTSLFNCISQKFTTNFGSSKFSPLTRNFDNFGILSSKKQLNPLFYRWSKVFIPACDSPLHIGYQPGLNSNIAFRGSKNIVAHINYLNQVLNLKDAQKTVISGTRNGGLAALLWGNYIYGNSENPHQVLTIVDNAIFPLQIMQPTFQANFLTIQSLLLETNDQTLPLQQCARDSQNFIFDCFNPTAIADYVLPPVFIIQSQYDKQALRFNQLSNCLQNGNIPSLISCTPAQLTVLQTFRTLLMGALKKFAQNQKNGMWVTSCVRNSFLDLPTKFLHFNRYEVDGFTIYEALEDFIKNYRNGKRKNRVDFKPWPYNIRCNGLESIDNL